MQIKAITTEQFVEIYDQLTNKTEQNLSATIKAYRGTLSGVGKVVITSDPMQCLMVTSD